MGRGFGDAYFCCLESEEIGLLDLGVTGTGLKDGIPTSTPGDQTRVISIKMTKRTQKDFFWVRFVYSLGCPGSGASVSSFLLFLCAAHGLGQVLALLCACHPGTGIGFLFNIGDFPLELKVAG